MLSYICLLVRSPFSVRVILLMRASSSQTLLAMYPLFQDFPECSLRMSALPRNHLQDHADTHIRRGPCGELYRKLSCTAPLLLSRPVSSSWHWWYSAMFWKDDLCICRYAHLHFYSRSRHFPFHQLLYSKKKKNVRHLSVRSLTFIIAEYKIIFNR